MASRWRSSCRGAAGTLTLSQPEQPAGASLRLFSPVHRGGPCRTSRRCAATTQWSYDLGSAAEQLLLARLSVFAGSSNSPPAEALCAGRPWPARNLPA